jgi:hypothetical protein
VLGFWVLLNGALRHISSVQFLSVTPHITVVGLVDAIGVVVAAALTILGIASRRRPARIAALLVAVGIFVFLEALHRRHEQPLVRDLAEFVAPVLKERAAVPPTPNPERFENARVLVIGYDGLAWEVLVPLLRRGEAPSFRALLEGAAYGNLATYRFTKSPLVWETISTGMPPERHGIGHHAHFEVRGLNRRISHLPYFRLGNSPMAVRRIMTRPTSLTPWAAVKAASSDGQAARFWEIAARSGLRIGLYNWLNTTPATALESFFHGYGPLEPVFFPSDLEEGLPEVPTAERPSGGTLWIDAYIVAERIHYERFVTLALRHQPELLLFYTHFGDAVNHLNWKTEAHGERAFISGLSHPDYEPGAAVSAAMKLLDEMLGDILARLPENTSVVLLSDHGFDFRGYEHDNAPPGVIILRGPGIRPGPFEGATIYDVTPTLLHLLGLPVAEDMEGEPLDVALEGGPLDRAVARVGSHGPALEPLAPGASDPEELQRDREYLRALGYVD